MATDGDRETGEEKVTNTPLAAQQVKVRWDDSSMRSAYANVCNVAGTREEIVLLFGMNQAWALRPEGGNHSARGPHRPEPFCREAAGHPAQQRGEGLRVTPVKKRLDIDVMWSDIQSI